jgi:hypothetical protein
MLYVIMCTCLQLACCVAWQLLVASTTAACQPIVVLAKGPQAEGPSGFVMCIMFMCILPAAATGTHAKLPGILEEAVKQHPQVTLSALEAGFRYMLSSGLFDEDICVYIAELPLLEWLLSGIPELRHAGGVGPAQQFDSAGIDEFVRHVCSLLRTLLKVVSAADRNSKQADHLLGIQHAAKCNKLLCVAGAHLDASPVAVAFAPFSAASSCEDGSSSSSSGSSSSGDSSSSGIDGPAAGSSSSSSNWQPPFLQ